MVVPPLLAPQTPCKYSGLAPSTESNHFSVRSGSLVGPDFHHLYYKVFDLHPHSQIPLFILYTFVLILSFSRQSIQNSLKPTCQIIVPSDTADMKFLATVETVGLMFLALATNFVGGMYHNNPIDKSILTFELKVASVAQRDTSIAAYRPDAILSVLETASELLAIQIIGAATSLDQLKFLCLVFPSNSSRLQSEQYDVALIQKIVCAAADEKTIPSLDEIKALTIEISTEIWIIQAIGAVQGKSGVRKLCGLINVSAASAIGLLGDLVKKDVCAAADVADKVGNSDKPAQVTLTAPLVNSIAPVSEVVLPFVPTKAA